MSFSYERGFKKVKEVGGKEWKIEVKEVSESIQNKMKKINIMRKKPVLSWSGKLFQT